MCGNEPGGGPDAIERTIKLLHELHLIDRINFDDGFGRYEMGSAPNREQKHRHHHLIADHEVKLYGYCIARREDRCLKDAEKLSGRG